MPICLSQWKLSCWILTLIYGAMLKAPCSDSTEMKWTQPTIANISDIRTETFLSSWAIRIPVGTYNNITSIHSLADRIASETGLANHGQIGGLKGHYLLIHRSYFNWTGTDNKNLTQLQRKITKKLSEHPEIDWSRQEIVRMRYKRSLQFKDQYFPSQWHLVCCSFEVLFIYDKKFEKQNSDHLIQDKNSSSIKIVF